MDVFRVERHRNRYCDLLDEYLVARLIQIAKTGKDVSDGKEEDCLYLFTSTSLLVCHTMIKSEFRLFTSMFSINT